jgi:hypothetical protein
MSARFTVIIEGIDDSSVAAEIENSIVGSFREMALPGDWRVIVKPSPVSGRFDFLVQGLDVRHAMSIAVPPSLLSALIPRRLRESLDQSAFCRAIAASTVTATATSA